MCVPVCLFLLISFLSTVHVCVCVCVCVCVWRLESRLLVQKSLLLSIVSVWAWVTSWLYTWLIAAALSVISPHCFSGWVTDSGFDRERRGSEPDSHWGQNNANYCIVWLVASCLKTHCRDKLTDGRHYPQQVKKWNPALKEKSILPVFNCFLGLQV